MKPALSPGAKIERHKNMYPLPKSVLELQEIGFDPDLTDSIIGFVQKMHNIKMCALGKQIAEEVASGLLKSGSFDPWTAMTVSDECDSEFVEKWRVAVQKIHQKFGHRLPVQLYQAVLFTGLRPNPEIEVKVPDVQHLLPDNMRWQVADAANHAVRLCDRLNLDMQTTLFNETGRIRMHGCGCDDCSPILIKGHILNVPMSSDPSVLLEETESFLRHFMAQMVPIELGVPHDTGPSMTQGMNDLREGDKRKALTVTG